MAESTNEEANPFAAFHIERLICKHFNLSWLDLQRNLNWGEYTCLLAEAMDAEELERYYWWINSQQDPKKWRWSSPDKAGTEPILPVYQQSLDLAPLFIGNITYEERHNKAIDFAKATGRPIVYMTPDKAYYDESGNQVMLFDTFGKPTKLHSIAVVIPVKKDYVQ
jgi:hypothetical protein